MKYRLKFGFPVYFLWTFRIGRHWYFVNRGGVTTLQLIEKIHASIPKTPSAYWLLRFREDIRRIRRLNRTAVLSNVVAHTPDRNVRALAIWLRGRSGGHLGTEIISRFATCPDVTIRKEVVRALRRMNAWFKLAEIAALESSPRIRQMAYGHEPKEYGQRLTKFAQNVTPTPCESRPQEFYIAPDVELGKWTPLKPVQLLREILEQIRKLVSARV